jgi:protein-L-isoaspartate(D-aspartate) O-methyltransferase
MMDFDVSRRKMVVEQLRARGIEKENVLAAFGKVARHLFVPGPNRMSAYADSPLSIGQGQTISQPYMVALMTEVLDLEGKEKVLEIGTGSGYQSAILCELADRVYTVEREPLLLNKARKVLSQIGYTNIKFKEGDGTLGWDEYKPYDAVMVTAAAPEIPASLLEQLKDNGKMVIPVGDRYSQVLRLIRKNRGRPLSKNICSCVFVPLLGKEGWK